VTYALRNSLILGLLLLAEIGCGYYWIEVRQTENLEELEALHSQLRDELEQIEAVMAIYDTTVSRLQAFEGRRQEQHQWLAAQDSPARTLAYLNELSERRGRRLNFDLHFQDQRQAERHIEHVYSLEGQGPFAHFFGFLHDLETGPLFYTADHVEIGMKEGAEVEFRMVLRAFSSGEPEPGQGDSTGPGLAAAPHNLFRPLIARVLPSNDLGLLELDGARLTALTHEAAFLSDRGGQIHQLHPGDPVFLGSLAEIDIRQNQAVFVLNKGGIVQRRTLEVAIHTSQR
jgi:hypothetical protein